MKKDKSLNIGFLVLSHFPALAGAEMANHFLATELNKIDGVRASVAMRKMRHKLPKQLFSYPVYIPFKIGKWERTFRTWARIRMIRKEKNNILFGPTIHTGGRYACEMAQKFKLPFVAQAHGNDVVTNIESGHGVCLDPIRKKEVVTILTKADKILAVSSLLKETIVSFGIDEEKVQVIPNGICYQAIQSMAFEDVRPRYQIKPSDFVLLTVGRNVPFKRLELVLEAFDALHMEIPELKWLIVGRNPEFGELIQSKSWSDRVVVCGTIPAESSDRLYPPYKELINHYRSANLFVSSSYIEPFGITSLEALACGTPILVSPRNGIRDIMVEGSNGKTFFNDDLESLMEGIRYFYQNREVFNQRRFEISESVREYSWEKIAQRVAGVFREVLNH